jgi:hypothetical protein
MASTPARALAKSSTDPASANKSSKIRAAVQAPPEASEVDAHFQQYHRIEKEMP